MAAPLLLSGIESPLACALGLGVGTLIVGSSAGSSVTRRVSGRSLGVLFAAMLMADLFRTGKNIAHLHDVIGMGIVVPLSYHFGVRISRVPKGPQVFVRTFVFVILLACLMAIYERRSGNYLLTGFAVLEGEIRDGRIRGRGFLPHPLVLALFVSVAIPLAVSRVFSRRLWVRILVIVVLFGGILSTDSRTAIPVVVFAALSTVAWTAVTRIHSRMLFAASAILLASMTVLPVALSALSGNFTLVTSTDSVTASKEFRAELYRQAPSILADNPFGTGFGRVPPNHLVVDSPVGPIDGSVTIDSEFVLSVVKFGWLGLVFWLVVLLRSGRSLGRGNFFWDIAALIVLCFGSVLALQSWLVVTGLLPIVFAFQWGAPTPRRLTTADKPISP
jgi:hypothetical protein